MITAKCHALGYGLSHGSTRHATLRLRPFSSAGGEEDVLPPTQLLQDPNNEQTDGGESVPGGLDTLEEEDGSTCVIMSCVESERLCGYF